MTLPQIQHQKHEKWHSQSAKDVLNKFGSSPNGLTFGEVELRLIKYGKNLFKHIEKNRLLKLFWRQIKSPLVFILLIAGFVTLFLKAYTDSIVIMIAVTINTVIGMIQEGKASRAFLKLKESQKRYATVVREGKKQVISSEDIVPGDILSFKAGDQISADVRIIDGKGLEINEAALTGEWMSNAKDARKIKEDALLPDRSSMAWMGTLVTDGWGMGVVVSTGFETEIGKIAKMIGEEEPPLTHFQKNIKKLAKFLGLVVFGALVFIFTIGVWEGKEIGQMFFTSVAIAVAAIPEGLPVAVSVVLAVGMERVLSKGGLVKRLSAAETLGSVDLILSDKTGTLTQSIMRVSGIVTLSSLGTEAEKKKQETAGETGLIKGEDKKKVIEMAILSSGGFIENPEDNLADWVVRGRAIEQAVIYVGIDSGIYSHTLLKDNPRLDFLEFDSQRRFSASLHDLKGKKKNIFVTGAPELLLSLSDRVYKNGRAVKFSKEHKEMFENVLLKQASHGARVISVGYKESSVKELPRNGKEEFKDFVFGGLILLNDPLRPNAAVSLSKAEKAGIRTIIMTGDHKGTAKKISEDVKVLKKGTRLITGDVLEKINNKDLEKEIEKISVFARVLPHQKLRIVKMWQDKKKTVAMTGDGINDAPSLRRAEIGIGLNSGTEVAKEASDLVLLKDDFSVIISAIEEGRRILLNLRKILAYLLSTGFSEIALVAASLLMGLPLPVLPAQILWTNLIEEGFMNFAFAFEPKEKGIMRRPPQSFSAKDLIDKTTKLFIIILAFFTSFFLISVFLVLHLVFKKPIEYTRTIMFAALSIDSIFFALSLKNFKKPIWKINIFSNIYLIASILISLIFLVSALYVPQLRYLLSLQKIGIYDTVIILGIGFINLFAIEFFKHFYVNDKNKPKKFKKK